MADRYPLDVIYNSVTEPFVGTDTPALSWAPKFPDFASANKVHPSQIQNFFTKGYDPSEFVSPIPYVTFQQPVMAPGRAPLPAGAHQHLALVIPQDTINVPKTNWRPRYPDLIPAKTSVTAADTPFFFMVLTADQIELTRRGWWPRYPDFARRLEIHPSLMPFFFELIPQDTIDIKTKMRWHPEYPDFARRRELHVSLMPFTTWQTRETLFPATDMKWLGFYDAITPWRKTLPVAAIPFSSTWVTLQTLIPPAPGTPNTVALIWAGLPYRRSLLGS